MPDRPDIQQLMPLLREFGSLRRKRLSEGMTPLEYQRWLDLRNRIGDEFAAVHPEAESPTQNKSANDPRTRLLVAYKSRGALLDALIENIRPVGFYVSTPFAAVTGTEFIARITIEAEGITADVPSTVVTSMVEGAHTISTMNMGMGLKIERLTRAQAAGVSKLFDRALDVKLGIVDLV